MKEYIYSILNGLTGERSRIYFYGMKYNKKIKEGGLKEII